MPTAVDPSRENPDESYRTTRYLPNSLRAFRIPNDRRFDEVRAVAVSGNANLGLQAACRVSLRVANGTLAARVTAKPLRPIRHRLAANFAHYARSLGTFEYVAFPRLLTAVALSIRMPNDPLIDEAFLTHPDRLYRNIYTPRGPWVPEPKYRPTPDITATLSTPHDDTIEIYQLLGRLPSFSEPSISVTYRESS